MEIKKGVPVPKVKISGKIKSAILNLRVNESLHVKKEECMKHTFNTAVYAARQLKKGTATEYVVKTDENTYNIWRVK